MSHRAAELLPCYKTEHFAFQTIKCMHSKERIKRQEMRSIDVFNQD